MGRINAATESHGSTLTQLSENQWRDSCDCGWVGPLWTRAATTEAHNPEERALYFLGPCIEYDFGDLLDADWGKHVHAEQRLDEIHTAHLEHEKAGTRLDNAVAAARRQGDPWETIAQTMRMTPSAAAHRWPADLTPGADR